MRLSKWAVLLIVLMVGVIGVGGGTIVLRKVSATLERVRIKTCADNLRRIHAICELAMDERGKRLSVADLLKEGQLSPSSLRCPNADPHSPDGCDYEFIPPEKLCSQPMANGKRPIGWDKKGNHATGRNVLWDDGRVTYLSEEKFSRIAKGFGLSQP